MNILLRLKPLFLPVLLFLALLPAGCSDGQTDYDTALSDARAALEQGDSGKSAEICSSLLENDIDNLDEMQLGRLAILFMKLSEVDNSDEDVADAMLCFRKAWKLSADSLRGFSSQLSPEELPQYAILSRINGTLDTPPDLSGESFPEDSIPFYEYTGED